MLSKAAIATPLLSGLKRHKWRVLLGSLAVAAIAVIVFDNADKAGISQLMEARDQAISSRSVSSYSALIAADYNDHGRGKVEVVAQMVSLFDKFERVEMVSHDRQIRKLSSNRAQCEQSYTLKVLADGQWRQIVQREQLTLFKDSSGWKIGAGL